MTDSNNSKDKSEVGKEPQKLSKEEIILRLNIVHELLAGTVIPTQDQIEAFDSVGEIISYLATASQSESELLRLREK
jgi:hypothetical protein